MSGRATIAILAIFAPLGFASCGADDKQGSADTSAGTSTESRAGGGSGAAAEAAIEDSRGGIEVDCPQEVPLDQGSEFECEYTEPELGTHGKMTVTVDEADSETARISYEGKATGGNGLETTARGSGDIAVPR